MGRSYTALDHRGRNITAVLADNVDDAVLKIIAQLDNFDDRGHLKNWQRGGCQVLAELTLEEEAVIAKQMEGLKLIRDTANQGYGISYGVASEIANTAIKELNRLRNVLFKGGYIHEMTPKKGES